MGRHRGPGSPAVEAADGDPEPAPTAAAGTGRRRRAAEPAPVVPTPAAAPPAPQVEPTSVEPQPPQASQDRSRTTPPEPATRSDGVPGPGVEVLAWTAFAAAIAWAVIAAAGHDLSDATGWAAGVAALVPLTLLVRAPSWLRARRERSRDQ